MFCVILQVGFISNRRRRSHWANCHGSDDRHVADTLNSLVKKMCEQVGITGKTNHSLRATGATRMFESKVPEMIIQQRRATPVSIVCGRMSDHRLNSNMLSPGLYHQQKKSISMETQELSQVQQNATAPWWRTFLDSVWTSLSHQYDFSVMFT